MTNDEATPHEPPRDRQPFRAFLRYFLWLGTFGFGGTGVSSPPSATGGASVSTAFSSFGRLNADGQGNFVQDSAGLASPLTQLQLTGTYTVNLDCSGTATLAHA